MKLKDQVCDLKYAKQLKKLGVEQYNMWDWLSNEPNKYLVGFSTHATNRICSAFTSIELMDMMPVYIKSEYTENNPDICKLMIVKKSDKKYCASYLYTEFHDKKMVNALAKLLIHILKKNMV